jgi:NADH:ubiquinone oxidoreductase subunit 5 (subunit L)/multisubunit Na+/H+ antiporter MnhA subunit
LINKFGDFNIVCAAVYIHNVLLTGNNVIINKLIFNYEYFICTYLIGIFLILSAITKSAQVIFSVWLPDAMEGPTPVSALLHSSTMVTAGYILLLKYYSVITIYNSLCDLTLYIGVITYYIGTARTTVCEDSKGSVAYSTIGQIGNLFISLIILP